MDVLTRAFELAGLPTGAAAATAASLSEAEASGKLSHGLIRAPHVVAETLREGPGEVSIQWAGTCALAVDGARHLGYWPGLVAIDEGTAIARDTGLCLAGIRNCRHSGALAWYVREIARRGQWGIALGDSVAKMAPHGGARAVLGTNPLAMGIPRRGTWPLVIDLSPAATTFGAVTVARAAGKTLPEGVGLDAGGRPSTDPAAVMEGAILPSAGHKGAALALMIQLLAGPLLGADPLPAKGGDYGLTLLMVRPGLFADEASVATKVEILLEAVTQCPPRAGFEAVRLPGEASGQALERARAEGLDVDRLQWERALALATAP